MKKVYALVLKDGSSAYFEKENNHCWFIFENKNETTYESHSWEIWLSDSKSASVVDKDNVTLESVNTIINNGNTKRNIWVEEISEVDSLGEYYPRINKNNLGFKFEAFTNDQYLDEIRSYANLCKEMDEIFNYINPTPKNNQTFGHKCRELLILACTEFEYLVLQFLKENNYPAKKRYTTEDYYVAQEVFKLNEYAVQLKMYPMFGLIAPFYGWDKSQPTKSMRWYDSYNKVKHDRGGNFEESNLINMIFSVSAIHIILVAQYGERIFGNSALHEHKSPFHTKLVPRFKSTEIILPNLVMGVGVQWQKRMAYFDKHPFKS